MSERLRCRIKRLGKPYIHKAHRLPFICGGILLKARPISLNGWPTASLSHFPIDYRNKLSLGIFENNASRKHAFLARVGDASPLVVITIRHALNSD